MVFSPPMPPPQPKRNSANPFAPSPSKSAPPTTKRRPSKPTKPTPTTTAATAAEAKFIEKDTQLIASQKQLAEWKKAHAEVTAQFKKAVEIGNTKEGERAKLAARVIVLDRQVADQKSKNSAMYKLGSEILSRYEKFGLGDVITRKEPFIGTTKVKFDTLIQDFTDGLADQKIKP
ncbi:MAG: hypothetical protein NTX04_05625 [Verrucomicrobia bacterium]|nr:hypothetical protein [Verrucomicrobiota bacterium]